jgi:hypothetical protein
MQSVAAETHREIFTRFQAAASFDVSAFATDQIQFREWTMFGAPNWLARVVAEVAVHRYVQRRTAGVERWRARDIRVAGV